MAQSEDELWRKADYHLQQNQQNHGSDVLAASRRQLADAKRRLARMEVHPRPNDDIEHARDRVPRIEIVIEALEWLEWMKGYEYRELSEEIEVFSGAQVTRKGRL